MKKIINLVGLLLLLVSTPSFSKGGVDIVVAQDGSGNFKTIQAAIDSVPGHADRLWIISIKNGYYNEKLFIQKSHIALVGENKDTTRIVFAELRENWNRDHAGDDWGSGVVNIDTGATDIIFANLTVYNNYGSLFGAYNKHQFAIRGAGTKIILLHCNVISDGGDALSLWNKEDGMYYHADCYFEGWVDFVCPRGWCYVTGCQFFGHNKPSASIWHDGSKDKSQKFVITSSFFDGVSKFPLGRNHLDGQFYLINCRFSANMADRPFFRPPSSPKEWQWGDRHYFFNSHRDGGDFDWFKDNLSTAEGSPKVSDITAKWTFDGQWDPEASIPSILPFACVPFPANDASNVSASGTKLHWVPGKDAGTHIVHFGDTNPPPVVSSTKDALFETGALKPSTTYFWNVEEVAGNDTVRHATWQFTTGSEK